jgi:hypothetical protein
MVTEPSTVVAMAVSFHPAGVETELCTAFQGT